MTCLYWLYMPLWQFLKNLTIINLIKSINENKKKISILNTFQTEKFLKKTINNSTQNYYENAQNQRIQTQHYTQ